MKEITLLLSDDLAANLSNLTESEKEQISRLVEDTLHPTGGDQIVMALTLLEKGFDISLVSKLTRLDETFLQEIQVSNKAPQ